MKENYLVHALCERLLFSSKEKHVSSSSYLVRAEKEREKILFPGLTPSDLLTGGQGFFENKRRPPFKIVTTI